MMSMMGGWSNWGMMNCGFGGGWWLFGIFGLLFWIGVLTLLFLGIVRLWQSVKQNDKKREKHNVK